MKTRRVLLFTNSYPFGSGEAFLEEEMKVWGNSDEVMITILPILYNSGEARDLPKNVNVDTSLCDKLKVYERHIAFLFPIVFSNSFFWKELITFPSVFFKGKKIRKTIAASVFSIVISNYLKNNYLVELNNKDTILYSYWFYYASYGSALLKRKGFVFSLYTRAHRADIYQNRKETASYIPYRRFPIWKFFKQIYPVSKEGSNYLVENQKIPKEKLTVSYLGVNIPKIFSEPTIGNSLTIVSCSYMISLKRINLIINGIEIYAKKNKDVSISWFHIGDGPLMSELSELAKLQLLPLGVEYNFLGQFSNPEVLDFYEHNKIDCFVTTSESEGLPVTIMEALSFGIPVMATDVGGITEAVGKDVGVILEKDFLLEDFVEGLSRMFDFKDQNKRNTIRSWANKNFNAKVNYEKFISTLLTFDEKDNK